jgi:hypothetical protein
VLARVADTHAALLMARLTASELGGAIYRPPMRRAVEVVVQGRAAERGGDGAGAGGCSRRSRRKTP